ncbi:hypothetical protein Q8F55_008527 [Vanrija albida]|uniref:Enoyl-CoA hydratase n=1 Tax=Vanrija albida TaxID=181172 RepID=A0ABR3PR97_9TREE
MSPPSLPASYAALPTQHIKLSNHPATAAGVTPVQVITLYRPDANNAFTAIMMQELVDTIEAYEADDRVKVIVITGHGKMFCAGADLSGNKAFKKTDNDTNGHRDGGGRVSLAIHRCSKPTIAAIQGSAVGVGITMTLPATIRIAAAPAKIGFVFARRGLVMEAASSFFLPKLIGYSRVLHIVTTGSVYPANHKLLDGLFSEVLEQPSAVLPRALELADDIAANCSGLSIALNKNLMYRALPSAEEQHLLDSRVMYGLYGTKDINEGVASFLEKRKVDFKGTIKDAPTAYPWWFAVDTRLPEGADKAKL